VVGENEFSRGGNGGAGVSSKNGRTYGDGGSGGTSQVNRGGGSGHSGIVVIRFPARPNDKNSEQSED
jgi:hypothetical protein